MLKESKTDKVNISYSLLILNEQSETDLPIKPEVKPEILQIYYIASRAVYKSYKTLHEKGTLVHEDILHTQNQYELKIPILDELDPIFHYGVKAGISIAKDSKNGKDDSDTPLKTYIAEAEEEINKKQVGFIQVCTKQINSKDYTYIAELAIAPEFQRQGIATKLINLALNEDPNLPCLILTRSFNEPAKQLYIKLGFQEQIGEEGERLVHDCGYSHEKYISLLKEPALLGEDYDSFNELI